jgi:acrylyl-CoA reductase (NADPH)
VHPFILRGVSLLGVDSVRVTREARLRAWARLRDLLPPALLDGLSAEVGLSGLPAAAERILAGQVRGRVVVDVAR